MDHLELFARAVTYGDRAAIVDPAGTYTYRQLLQRSTDVAQALGELDVPDADRDAGADATQDAAARSGRAAARISRPADGPSVAYLVAAGFGHVATQWGIWRAGAIGVPLSAAQAPAEWAYVIADSGARVVVADAALASAVREAVGDGATVVVTDDLVAGSAAPSEPGARRAGRSRGDGRSAGRSAGTASDEAALILYTSGTTGKPKGVVLTHANIEAQARCLVAAWEWRADDRILHVLPLNHVHGIVNVLTCALWAGAVCEMLPRFDAPTTWSVIASARLTVFMAVPTIYARLIAAWEGASPQQRLAMSNGCRAMRLMVSGSAALPVRVLERWREISGHVLLERYGMTEIGMALSNPLKGERRPGFVGVPLPGVEVRIVDEAGRVQEAPPVTEAAERGIAGELEVRGPGVFREYWRRPDATRSAFRDGWFRTGDVAVVEHGMYRLLGRQSVDILKSGGYKISALEIEEVLREHPAVLECAVVGVDDPEWGERIAVAVVASGDGAIDIDALREWARPRMARYKLPTRLVVVPELPRNAMGKVSKPAVKDLFKTPSI